MFILLIIIIVVVVVVIIIIIIIRGKRRGGHSLCLQSPNRGLFCISMRDRWLNKEHATSDSDRGA